MASCIESDGKLTEIQSCKISLDCMQKPVTPLDSSRLLTNRSPVAWGAQGIALAPMFFAVAPTISQDRLLTYQLLALWTPSNFS